MRRREVIAGLGSAAALWPLSAFAQRLDHERRIGVLQTLAENDPATKIRTTAFVQGLQEHGWTQAQDSVNVGRSTVK